MQIYIPITWMRWDGTNYPYRVHQPQLTEEKAIEVAREAMMNNYSPAPAKVVDTEAKSLGGMPACRYLEGWASRRIGICGSILLSSIELDNEVPLPPQLDWEQTDATRTECVYPEEDDMTSVGVVDYDPDQGRWFYIVEPQCEPLDSRHASGFTSHAEAQSAAEEAMRKHAKEADDNATS